MAVQRPVAESGKRSVLAFEGYGLTECRLVAVNATD